MSNDRDEDELLNYVAIRLYGDDHDDEDDRTVAGMATSTDSYARSPPRVRSG